MKDVLNIKAEPSDVAWKLSETAFLVIDVQKDFVNKGGYGELLGNNPELLQKIIKPTQAVLSAVRSANMIVIHTREGHLSDLSDCPDTKLTRWPEGNRIGDDGPMGRILIRGEEGHAIVDELEPQDEELVIDKPGKNSFFNTNLESELRNRGIVNLLVAGVTTDVCCFTTITAANDLGFNAMAIQDCMASYDNERHIAALDIIKAQGGIFGWVARSEEILDALNR